MAPRLILCLIALAWGSHLGCWSSSPRPAAGGTAGSAGAGGPGGAPPPPPPDATVTVDVGVRHQTMVGFGGTVAYYAGYLAQRDASDEVWRVLFTDLGLDVLRVANWHQNQIETGTSAATPFSDTDTVTLIQKATAALGHAPKITMSSWSPPAYLKSNGDTKNGGTLAKSGGAFQYAAFGQWWASALSEYSSRGVKPDFISVQNEPDFESNYETCRFDPAEGANAGYGQALDAVHDAIAASALSPKPRIWAPEPIGIGYNVVQSYLAGITLGHVDGVAHHLYHGGDTTDDPAPGSFDAAMQGVAASAGAAGKPTFMTEFQARSPSMFNTAWLIYEALTVEGVSAYIHWPLFWVAPASAPLPPVTLEDPAQPFTTPKGYTVNDIYYALKHYARWVDADWVRVEATATAAAIKVSAFVSPDGSRLTVILLNTDTIQHVVGIAPVGFAAVASTAYRTSGAAERLSEVALTTANAAIMPAQSIVTLAMTR